MPVCLVAWETGFEMDRVITTIVLDQVEFQQGPLSKSSLIEAIRREGVAG